MGSRRGSDCYQYRQDPGARAAVVIDPTLDPDVYLQMASAHGATVEAVWETHTHADHISSARHVGRKAGVALHMPAKAGAAIDHVPISPSTHLRVGDLEVRALDTPGHTPDAMTFLVGDDAIVGDTLLVGTVGRADFYPAGPEELYHSIFDKVLRLSDSVRIHPCHYGPKHGLPETRETTMATSV